MVVDITVGILMQEKSGLRCPTQVKQVEGRNAQVPEIPAQDAEGFTTMHQWL